MGIHPQTLIWAGQQGVGVSGSGSMLLCPGMLVSVVCMRDRCVTVCICSALKAGAASQ